MGIWYGFFGKIYTYSHTFLLGVVCKRVYDRGHNKGETMKSREVIKKLEADGWQEVAQAGSHKQFKHPKKPGRVTVPHPKKDLKIGTLISIEKQSGVRLR